MDVHWTLAALREMDRRLVTLKMIDCRACGRPERMRVEPRPALIYLGEQQYPEMYFEIHCNECGYTFLWKRWAEFDPNNLHRDLTRLSEEEQLAADPAVLNS